MVKTESFQVNKVGGKKRTKSRTILEALQQKAGPKKRVEIVSIDWANARVTYDVT